MHFSILEPLLIDECFSNHIHCIILKLRCKSSVYDKYNVCGLTMFL